MLIMLEKTTSVSLPVLLLWLTCFVGVFACADITPTQVCPVPTEMNYDDNVMRRRFEGIDLLFVVDNTMPDRFPDLVTRMAQMVNSLVNPTPGCSWPSKENVRVAVSSSDMGLSWNGKPYEYGDEWPGKVPCSAVGDDGLFSTYPAGKTVQILNDVIPCYTDDAQCPAGWTCEDPYSTGIGVCHDPDGNGEETACPAMQGTWFEDEVGENKSTIAYATACMSDVGTDGCEFEQPFSSALKALGRPDQSGFIRQDALLVVVVISDEDDCSIEDGPALFGSDEVQGTDDGDKQAIACGENPDGLFSVKHIYEALVAVKAIPDSVFFVGVVGVPDEDDTCQGNGWELANCLEHPAMQLNPNITSKEGVYQYSDACVDSAGRGAKPGRRFVQLASEEFGWMSSIVSICEDDWSGAVSDIAWAATPWHGCFERPLKWDAAKKTAVCDLLVEFYDREECPPKFGDSKPEKTSKLNHSDNTYQDGILCKLPKIPIELDCRQNNFDQVNEQFGWYYCENLYHEDFKDACEDGEDNDNDGLVDCEDPDCQVCQCCCGAEACTGLCKYVPEVTPEVEEETWGKPIVIRCIRNFSSKDPNCKEDSFEACNDGLDNDMNGIWDCDSVSVDEDMDNPHSADPNCCPMRKEGTSCVDINTSFCGGMSDACIAHASLLGCNPPDDLQGGN